MEKQKDLKVITPKGRQKILYDEISKIYQQNNKITPEQILDFAKDKKHPLHNYFEWDDAVAGNKYRLIQARELIRSIILTIQDQETKQRFKVRAYLSVNVTEEGDLTVNGNHRTDNYFVDQNTVKDDTTLINYQLLKAKAELKSFREKFKILSTELEDVFKAIDKL